MVSVLSLYSWEVTVWKPMAGPPERTSNLMPMSLPCEYSSPETRFLPASIDGFGPRSWYSPPCSDSGFQSVWMETVSGHTPFSVAGVALAEPAALPEAIALPEAAAPDIAALAAGTLDAAAELATAEAG